MLDVARFAMAACLSCGLSLPLLAQPDGTDTDVGFGSRTQLGTIQPASINEASGLVASRGYPGHFWVHNDNGRYPGLFLIDSQGKLRATVQLDGAAFQDWEDLAMATLDGEPHLVVADCGDNSFRRDNCRLFVLPEPELEFDIAEPVEATISEFMTVSFRYPDGPRDCEAIAADATGNVWLLTKRHQTDHPEPAWYKLSLKLDHTDPVQTAQRLESRFTPPLVTAMDICPNDRLCVVRTYGTAWLFCKSDNQSWTEVIEAQEPDARTLLPVQPQGEVAGFALDSSGIVVTSEGIHPAIWKIDIAVADRR